MRLFGPTQLRLLLIVALVCVAFSWLCRRRPGAARALFWLLWLPVRPRTHSIS